MRRTPPPGGRSTPSRARAVARNVAVVAALLWLAMQGTAGAHTEVLRADPQPGTDTAGPIDRIRLTFLDPVRPGTTIGVTDDAGEPVAGLGPTEQRADGLTATVGFEPLSVAGGYVVTYRFTAEDGDEQVESYRFTLRSSALAAGGGADDDDGLRTDTAGLGAAAVLGATLLAALVVALARRTRPGAASAGA